ncbi:MAG: glutathione ABC transporter permease GsiC [Legionellales bacterium]|nr:glutathione ABC transporter permease GsiC [Legionellales bacterium]
MLGESARVADRYALRESLGLNLSITQQWLNYLNNFLHFDLGKSLYSNQLVIELLFKHIPDTFLLSLASLFVAILIAVPLGIFSAVYKGSILDKASILLATLGISIPNFVMGPLLILIFSLWLGWFPVSGNDEISSIILPALTLGSALAAILSRMIRSSMLETLQQDYIRSARARGITEFNIIVFHALRNAALPVVTVLGMQFGALLAGAVITETVFSWPGIGQLMIESIQKRDYPVVQGCVLLISFTYVLVNLITDFICILIDPRIHDKND